MEASERLALTSVAVNLLVTGLKYFLGVFSGSLALLADAVHSTADVVSSAFIWAGIRLSRRKTKRFPYGLYKVENLVALITAGIVLLAGYEILRRVLWAGEQVKAERLFYAMLGIIVIVVILLVFTRYELRKARELKSPSLEADAHHLATDLFSSCIILAGLGGTYWRVPYPLDKAAALIIVLLIARVGLKIAMDALRVLLDASLDFHTLSTIREIIQAAPQVSEIKSLTGRNSGRFIFIEAELTLKVKDLDKAHYVAHQIENRIKSLVPQVDRVLLHYEPMEREIRVVALPVKEDRAHLSEHFGEAPYFLLLTIRNQDKQLLEEKFLANPHRSVKTGKGIKVSEWLVGLGVEEVFLAKSLEHKGPYYVFADAGVQMQQTDETDLVRIKAGLIAPESEKTQSGLAAQTRND